MLPDARVFKFSWRRKASQQVGHSKALGIVGFDVLKSFWNREFSRQRVLKSIELQCSQLVGHSSVVKGGNYHSRWGIQRLREVWFLVW